MAILTEKIIDEALDNLHKSLIELANGAAESIEFQSNHKEVSNFLSSQFEIRLKNLLGVKGIDIQHLESGMKNKIIQRKQKIFDEISKLFKI